MTEYKKGIICPLRWKQQNDETYLKMIMLLVQAPLSVGNLTLFDRQGLSISSGNSAHVLTVISQVNYIALCTDIISSSLRVLATFSV